MRSLIVLILLLIVLVSCDKKHSPANETKFGDSVVVYNEEVYYKITHGMIKIVDTACISEEKKAREDIEDGKLVYTLIRGISGPVYSNREMARQLSGYSIAFDSIFTPCMLPPKGFRWHCYADLMNAEVEKKFGEKFIDSLRIVADAQYIKNHPKFVFPFHECDTTSRYALAKTYDEYLKMPKDDFLSTLNYGGLSKKELKKLHADTSLEFTLYKNGSIGAIKAESDLNRVANKDFADYFEKEAIAFVKHSKWKAAKYKGIDVNSTMYLRLYN